MQRDRLAPGGETHITLAHATGASDFARHLPVTGTVERVVRAKDGATWQLLRLEQPIALTPGTCGWVLVLKRETDVEEDGTQVSTYDVLRAAPQVADGFDAAIFERLGRARSHPPRDPIPAPPPKPSWRNIGIATCIMATAGVVIWRFWDSPYFPMKVVVRIAIELLGGLK